MSEHDDQGQSSDQGPYEQPWREERHQPQPKAVEGQHAGRRVPEELQRETRADTGVGAASRVEGDQAGSGGRGSEEGMTSGAAFGDPGSGHQGSTSTPASGPSSAHARGHGRDTEGAFGEERGSSNANPFNDFRDAAISDREIGPSGSADRTQGG